MYETKVVSQLMTTCWQRLDFKYFVNLPKLSLQDDALSATHIVSGMFRLWDVAPASIRLLCLVKLIYYKSLNLQMEIKHLCSILDFYNQDFDTLKDWALPWIIIKYLFQNVLLVKERKTQTASPFIIYCISHWQ